MIQNPRWLELWRRRPRWLHQLRMPPLPGGARLWITLASAGFLLAALVSHGRQLLQLSLQLSQEQQRHIRENLSEEELAMFDILLQSAPDLSDSDRAKVKQSARELVERIKALLVLNWQQKSSARAKLKLQIQEALDIGLPRAYTPELYQQKCEAVFAHIEKAYPERDRSVYG